MAAYEHGEKYPQQLGLLKHERADESEQKFAASVKRVGQPCPKKRFRSETERVGIVAACQNITDDPIEQARVIPLKALFGRLRNAMKISWARPRSYFVKVERVVHPVSQLLVAEHQRVSFAVRFIIVENVIAY